MEAAAGSAEHVGARAQAARPRKPHLETFQLRGQGRTRPGVCLGKVVEQAQ